MKTITDLDGVFASGIHCGIKPQKRDLGFLYVPNACASAGVVTQNRFVAPCVTMTKKALKKATVKALIVNSGNANAGCGDQGEKDARVMAQKTAKALGLTVSEVAVASTGIIATPLPMDAMKSGIDTLFTDPNPKEGSAFAESILTTDTGTKTVYCERKIGKKTIVVAGVAKGSGMIAPNMATMLGFLVTNVKIGSDLLQELFSDAVDRSFNMISVDSDTSTNDMALIFATGERQINLGSSELAAFTELLTEACVGLAKQIILDGEGSNRIFEVAITGAASVDQARKMALNVVNSPLVKTAVHGADPNWGRILAAAGKDPSLKLNPNKVDLKIGAMPLLKDGQMVSSDRAAFAPEFEKDEVKIGLDLNLGQGAATAWGCELTKGYIDINTAYS